MSGRRGERKGRGLHPGRRKSGGRRRSTGGRSYTLGQRCLWGCSAELTLVCGLCGCKDNMGRCYLPQFVWGQGSCSCSCSSPCSSSSSSSSSSFCPRPQSLGHLPGGTLLLLPCKHQPQALHVRQIRCSLNIFSSPGGPLRLRSIRGHLHLMPRTCKTHFEIIIIYYHIYS